MTSCMYTIYHINFTVDNCFSVLEDKEAAEAVGEIALEGIFELIDIDGDIFKEGIASVWLLSLNFAKGLMLFKSI